MVAKIYLAARFGRRDEMSGYADELIMDGHQVASRWVYKENQLPASFGTWANHDQENTALAKKYAGYDAMDVQSCDACVLFTCEPGEPGSSSGGRHVEFGMAWALGKRCLVVGPPENIFHVLPSVVVVPTWKQARDEMRRWL